MFDLFSPLTYTNFLSLNWLSVLCVFLLPSKMWSGQSGGFILVKQQMMMTYELSVNSFKSLYYPGVNMVFSCIIIFILLNNMLGLLPFVFTASSHLSFNMAIALPLWTGSVLLAWGYSFNSWLGHLTPLSAPLFLAPFLVVVELVSFSIRPMTLSLRLTTNMVAGHVLLSLLSGPASAAPLLVVIVLLGVVTLMMVLELAVAYIQAYVFSTLMMLYFVETYSVNQA